MSSGDLIRQNVYISPDLTAQQRNEQYIRRKSMVKLPNSHVNYRFNNVQVYNDRHTCTLYT